MENKTRKKMYGVRFRYHNTRRYGAVKDKYWLLRHYITVDGIRKQIEEGLGWSSDGMTELDAIALAKGFKYNKKHGIRPQSMKEKREMLAEEEREAAEALQKDRDANLPFDVFFDQFLEDRETEGRPRAELIKCRSNYTKWAKSTIGEIPPRKLKILNFKGIVRKMEKAGSAPRTIIGVIGMIGQAYNHHIVHHNYLYPNPVNRKAILPPRVKKHNNRRERYLSVEEADLLLATLPEPVRTMALMSLHMGFRAGELLKLKWADINDTKISIRDTKSGQPRSLTMTNAVKDALLSMERGKNNVVVFTHSRTPVPMKEIPKVFKRIVDKLGLNDDIEDRRQRVVFHTLRHTCASWLVRAGIDLYTVKEVLGHSSITVTERYVHEGAKFSEAASVMDSILSGKKEEVANG